MFAFRWLTHDQTDEASFDPADGFRVMQPSQTRLGVAPTHRFPKFQHVPWLSLTDTLDVVVGVVLVQRGRHCWSSPEFVKHELLFGRVQRRAGKRFVRACW